MGMSWKAAHPLCFEIKNRRRILKMEKTIKRYFPLFMLPTMLAFVVGFLAPFA